MHDNINQVDVNMRRSSRNNDLRSTLYKSKGSVLAITKVLLYFKLCSLWLLQMLMSGIRYSGWSHPFAKFLDRLKLRATFLTLIRTEIDEIAPQVIPTEDEIRACAVGRRHQTSLLWWQMYSCEFSVYGENSEPWLLYWNTYTKKQEYSTLTGLFHKKTCQKICSSMATLGDTCVRTTEFIIKFGSRVLLHLHYTTELPTSDVHSLVSLNDSLRGRH